MKLLLYCTKAKPMLRIAKEEMKNQNRARCYSKEETKYFTQYIEEEMYEANGKIVAECDYEVEKIKKGYGTYHASFDERGYFDDYYDYMTKTIDEDILLKRSCLNIEELETYNPNYAIHIKNLNVFDKPKFLEGFDDNRGHTLRKAPQNMCKVLRAKIGDYDYKDLNSNAYEPYILISIRPEWLCKILNGEKTIEVRKKVLKEMK